MEIHHDEDTNRWFRLDERCAPCYLNHPHTFEKHVMQICEAEVARDMDEIQWVIRGSQTLMNEFNLRKSIWMDMHAADFRLYDNARDAGGYR